MKVSKRDSQILIGFLGVLVAALSYFFVYTKYQEKTETLIHDNATLTAEVQRLEGLSLQKEKFLEDTKSYNEAVEKISAKYDAGLITEDRIMFIHNMEQNIGRESVFVNFVNLPEYALVTGYPETSGKDNGVQLYKATTDFGFSATSYDGLKQMLRYIGSSTGRKNFESISIGFDSETGNLSGSVLLNLFFMTNTNQVYTPTSIPTMTQGVDNIFRTADKYIDQEMDTEIEAE